MKKIQMTMISNSVICLLGLLLSIGFGPQNIVMYAVFAVLAIFVVLYRRRFYQLPLFALGLMTYVFFNNYMFSNGSPLGYAMNSSISSIIIVTSACCFVIYWFYNFFTIKNLTNDTK